MRVDETKNEYRIRIRNPFLFRKNTIRTKIIRSGLKFIIGKLKSKPISAKTKVQAIHFDKSKWTSYTAQLWTERFIAKHKIKHIGFAVGGRLSPNVLGVDFFR